MKTQDVVTGTRIISSLPGVIAPNDLAMGFQGQPEHSEVAAAIDEGLR